MLGVRLPVGGIQPVNASAQSRPSALASFRFASSRPVLRNKTLTNAAQGAAPATAAEEEANKKRWEESGAKQGSVDEWRWTLNWDEITDAITVGSCPRSPSDIDAIAERAGCDAILCLQCSMCHEALEINWPVLRERAVSQGILMTRVAVRDFDHNDQALMLPEAVRMLYVLLSMGRRVYVHCTAGINRATLTVVGYLTFVKGMDLESAERLVKGQRPQAHPYIDCWRTVRSRMLEGRREEVKATARRLGADREQSGGANVGSADDWVTAEETLIRELFDRQVEASMTLVDSICDFHASQFATAASLLTHQAGALRRGGPLPEGCGDGNVAPEGQVLEGCVLALDIAKEATSTVEELKTAMSEVARMAGDALAVPPTRNGNGSDGSGSNGNGSNGNGSA